MVKNKHIISKTGFFLICILLFSLFPKSAIGSFDIDLPKNKTDVNTDQISDLINFQPSVYKNQIKRYIVFGSGSVSDIVSRANHVTYGADFGRGSFAMGFFNQDEVSNLKLNGYNVIEDLPLEFDSLPSDLPVSEVSRIDQILGSDKVIQKYGYTGNGINIGIVDTGTDFSNPDVKGSVARDKNNIPVMIDADGQGIVI